ncbi:MAG: metallophosphoesterase [Oscillatoriales cyanobacterium SM2_2_1]|nr:metallophosphoesterase [Oscillatoriales cyanobacterium SM2_2_1]
MQKYLAGRLKIETVAIAIPNLMPAKIKISHLTDFHYDGKRLSDRLLKQAIAASNQWEPDLVVLTGDYVTDDPQPITQLAYFLKHLESRYGIYAVLGNHDLHHMYSRSLITETLQGIGIRTLWNEALYPLSHSNLQLVGMPDYWDRAFDAAKVMGQVDPQQPCLVLSHNPDSVLEFSGHPVTLQLSGHTHGGQIVIPGMGPVLAKMSDWRPPRWLLHSLPSDRANCHKVVKHWEWAEGLHQVGHQQLYVNRGLGTYMPGRFNCPPEVTWLELYSSATTTLPRNTA